jgi:hypothetical protein
MDIAFMTFWWRMNPFLRGGSRSTDESLQAVGAMIEYCRFRGGLN